MAYASEDPAGIAAELLSLVLIVLSFAVISWLTVRYKGTKTFQFEMFIFTVVLIVAEVPRTVYSLGFIDIDALSTVGLAIHSVSMVILTGFVAFRIRGFFSTGKKLSSDFIGTIRGAVMDGLSTAIGPASMKSVEFYIGGDVAANDPSGYARSLTRLFGSGGALLLDKVIQSICDATKIEKKQGMTLEDAVKEGRPKFLAAGTPLSV